MKHLVLLFYRFIGEESTAAGSRIELTNSPTWIIDPIDGTLNFVHGYPVVSISVALLVDKVTELGVVYNPLHNQLFSARRGRGTFLNDRPIRVSGKTGESTLHIYFIKQGGMPPFTLLQPSPWAQNMCENNKQSKVVGRQISFLIKIGSQNPNTAACTTRSRLAL